MRGVSKLLDRMKDLSEYRSERLSERGAKSRAQEDRDGQWLGVGRVLIRYR